MSDANKPESFGFDFAPDWARKSADEYVSRYQGKTYDERTGREERPRRDGDFRNRPPRRDGDRRPRRDGDGDRRPRREGDGERRFRRPSGESQAPRAPRRDGERRPFVKREFIKPLDAEIRILPNQKNLGMIIKTLQSTHIAYPVKKFVTMFLENPQACLVRFEAKPETDVQFWSCKTCGLVALSEDEIVQHLTANHLTDFFDATEEACEAPSGSFPRVAKCPKTGEWVGAPNHHSYKHRVAELAARVGMSEHDYTRQLEMHTDEESIAAWKQSVTTQTVYRLKSAAPAPVEGAEAPVEDLRPAYTHDQAEAIFRREILPTQIASAKHVCLPVSLAQTSPSKPLVYLLNNTLTAEQRSPRSLFYALRGAFRHRKFALFRANDPRGPEFVANMTPSPFTAEHMVRELAAALQYVTDHPLCTRSELLAALKVELADMDHTLVARQIAFLFQKGHIVEYYNGVLALPTTNPGFRKLPEETKRNQKEAPAAEKPAEVTEAPVEAAAETPAAEAPTETVEAPAAATEAPATESPSEGE